MRRRAAAFVLLGLLAVLSWGAWLGAGEFLVVSDPLPAHADAIVILAGSPPARLLEATELYRSGLAPRIVLTRERRPPATVALARRGVPVDDPDTLAQSHLIALGIPAEAITILNGRAYSTTSEAQLIARWGCRSHIRSLVVVTSPSHTRRARLILRRLVAPGTTLAVRPAPADFFPRRRWWRSRRSSKLVLSEYEKLANYWLSERWRLRPCRER
jgi:uncharacterized SAM-binding protein YcdF (DUF218 family)